MVIPLRQRWAGLVLLVVGVSWAVALALTWANGQLTRQLLWEQGQGLKRDPARPWHIEIEELTGGLGATVCRFRLYDRRGLTLEVSGRLRHRLLTASFAGDVYLLGGPEESGGQRSAPSTGIASFQGQARYRPASGTVWSARAQGQGIQSGTQGWDWKLETWSAFLAGNSASMTLNLPELQAEGARVGAVTLRGAELELVDVPRGAGGSGRRLVGRARVESLELRLPRARADASGVTLEGHIELAPVGWPFDLELTVAELVHKGFPFTRLSDLRYRVHGQASSEPLGARTGTAAGGASLAWRSRQSLEAKTDYGPLHGNAAASGTLDPGDVPEVSELRLVGLMPRGLWSVLERLNGRLASQLVGEGLVKLSNGEARVRAEYLGGGWHASVREP